LRSDDRTIARYNINERSFNNSEIS
jgi:hypothetical protein